MVQGWKVVTGASSVPSSAAITSLLPSGEGAVASLADSFALAPFSAPQGLDPALPLGLLPAIPEAKPSNLDQLLRSSRDGPPPADGHSSGHSGSGHLTPPGSPSRKPPGALPGRQAGSKGPASKYQLRTRSSSLRAAWVEAEAEEEPAAPAAEASCVSDDESARSDSDREDAKSAGKDGKPGHAKRAARLQEQCGDPKAAHLTDLERRKLKRRIANRESARRVRAKRAELMDELQVKCTALGQQNGRLLTHVALVESQNGVLVQQVGLLQEKLTEKASEAMALYNQLFALRKHLNRELALPPTHDSPVSMAAPPSPLPPQGTSLFVPVSHGHSAGAFNGAGPPMQALPFL